MKPCKLSILGINSYVTKQVVNFEELALGNLFGVFGETGCGKSTILDCIIYALYGSPDRDNKLETFINLNSNYASVEFEFEFENPKTFKMERFNVLRTLKRAKSGIKTYAELKNVTLNEMIAEDTYKVNAAIFNMLRIGKKEFKRCIALPQGEFDEFLLCTPAEKKASIAKLFNAEIYGKKLIDAWAKRKQDLDVKMNLLGAQISAVNLPDNVDLSKLETELNNIKKQINKTEKSANSAFEKFQIAKENLKNKTNYANNLKTLKQLELKQNEMIKLNEKLQNYNKISETILLYNNFEELSGRNESLINEVRQLENNKAELLKEREILSENANLTNSKLSNLNVKKAEISVKTENVETIRTNLKNCKKELDNLKNELNSVLNKLSELTSLKSDYENKIKEQIKVVSSCQESLNFELQQLKQSFNGKAQETILKAIEKLNEVIKTVKNLNLVEVREMLLRVVENNNDNTNVENLVAAFNKLNEQNKSLNNLKNEQEKVQLKINETNANCTKINYAKSLELEKFDKYKTKLKESEILEEQLLSVIKEIAEKTKLLNSITAKQKSSEEKLELVTTKLSNNKILQAEVLTELKHLEAVLNSSKISKEQILNERNSFENFNAKQAELEVEEFNKLLNFAKMKNEELGVYANLKITESEVNLLNDSYLSKNSEKEKLIAIFAKLESEIEIVKHKKQLIEEYLKEREALSKKIEVYNNLNKYIMRNQLSDFVAEEYLHIVTQIANEFSYSLTEGKLEIEYSAGEFIIIDNFNAGLKRGVKSLSGGERFIVSLCLSLGISRALSKNAGRNFNFLFIDEGFGSLSEKYISGVLNCFNRLIRLNFTIGVITHVEQLKEYIINKIEVEKVSSSVGSEITMFS